MADDGDHVAASANNQAGPPRLSHLRVNSPQTLTMMDLKEEGWKLWKQEWKNYVKITQLDKHLEDVQTALLLHCAARNILRVSSGGLAVKHPVLGANGHRFKPRRLTTSWVADHVKWRCCLH